MGVSREVADTGERKTGCWRNLISATAGCGSLSGENIPCKRQIEKYEFCLHESNSLVCHESWVFITETYIDAELCIVDGVAEIPTVCKVIPISVFRIWHTKALEDAGKA